MNSIESFNCDARPIGTAVVTAISMAENMLTQIYEISNLDEARLISAIGVDHIGVLVGNGEFPRELPLQTVSRVAGAILPPSKLSLLFLTADLSLIEQWGRQLNPAIVHLGAAPELLSPDDTAMLKSRLPGTLIMRSIPVVDETSIALALSYKRIADFLLLDSHRPSDRQIGALGITHDWSISRRIVELWSDTGYSCWRAWAGECRRSYPCCVARRGRFENQDRP